MGVSLSSPYRSCRRWPLLIYRLVGKALAPLDGLTRQIRERTAEDLARPLELPDSGDEVAELARAFNQMSWRLNQAFVLQKNFSHNAAHEFRAPLAILKARIGLFRKKQDFQPQATLKFLGILESEADRLSAVVGSLLGCYISSSRVQFLMENPMTKFMGASKSHPPKKPVHTEPIIH